MRPAKAKRDLLDARLRGLSPRAARSVRSLAEGVGRRDLAAAEQTLGAALALAPDHPEVLRLQGLTYHLSGRHAEAAAALREALKINPDDPLVLNNLGSVLRASGDMDAALSAYTEATRQAPELAAAWYNRARLLKSLARLDDALLALEHALKAEPEHVAARVVLGDVLKALGDIEGSATAYRQVLQLRPGHAMAWFGLANLKTVSFSADELTRLQGLWHKSGQRADDRIALGFALAAALDNANKPAEAFAVLQQTNALKRERLPWDARSFSSHVDAIAKAFAPPAAAHAPADQGGDIIFLVSLPRSGSTLVEQILASHDLVEGAGELPNLPALVAAESQRRGQTFPEWVAKAGSADWQRLGQDYLQGTAHWRARHKYSTDKCLDNWPLVGAALAMLPAARIVVCRRDPLETCVACYRQLFANGQAFSYQVDDLAACWHDFDRLCRQWKTCFPDRVHEVIHEQLLADPEGQIRRLLDACGLPFQAACLQPHRRGGSVRTASAGQVRQPMRKQTGRAHRYGKAVDGLRQALARHAPGSQSNR